MPWRDRGPTSPIDSFDGMATAWPNRTGPTAERFNTLPKYVVSSQLRETTWAPTTILSGGTASVRELKLKGEGRLLVWEVGSSSKRWLRQASSTNTCSTCTPLVLGKGARLFVDGRGEELELTDTKTYARGVVALRYRPPAT